MFQALLVSLPAAAGIALSPFPVIAVVLIAGSANGRRNGVTFAAGWLVGLSLLAAIGVALLSGTSEDSSVSTLGGVLRVALGLALLFLAWRNWSGRPKPGEAEPEPKWMTTLDTASARTTWRIGALLGGVNPKNIMLVAAAASSMVATGAEGSTLAGATIAFVLVSSTVVVGAVIARLWGGQTGAALLERVRTFMVAHSTIITVVILVLLGLKALLDGIDGLRS